MLLKFMKLNKHKKSRRDGIAEANPKTLSPRYVSNGLLNIFSSQKKSRRDEIIITKTTTAEQNPEGMA